MERGGPRLVARTREASKMNDLYERMVRGAEDTKEPPKHVQRSARTDMDKPRRPDTACGQGRSRTTLATVPRVRTARADRLGVRTTP